MSMKQVPIAQASQKQLLHFARVVMQLDVRDNALPNEIKAKLKAAGFTGDTIEYEAEGVDEPKRIADPKPAAEQPGEPSGKPEKVKLQIAIENTQGGDQPVYVGVNGKGMFIPRGEPVEVPYPYYEALNNARQYRYDSDDHQGLRPPVEVPTYPFSVFSQV